MDMDFDGLKADIVQMLGGGHVRINTRSFRNDMRTFHVKDDVLTLLIHLGYLAYDTDKKETFIPNEEVKQEVIRAITASKHTEIAKLIDNSDNLIKQTLNMNEKAVAEAIEEAHKICAAPIVYNNEEALRCSIRIARSILVRLRNI